MKSAQAKIPFSVLAQALAVALIVGIPFLFVAISQMRRACGSRLFGSREYFCSTQELGRWLLSLSDWSQLLIAAAIIGVVASLRWLLHRLAA
jgi:hypothetical protein